MNADKIIMCQISCFLFRVFEIRPREALQKYNCRNLLIADPVLYTDLGVYFPTDHSLSVIPSNKNSMGICSFLGCALLRSSTQSHCIEHRVPSL
jgi:hypothetical protein